MQVKGQWSDARVVDPIFVDEMQIQDLGDRCYITFGQIRLPSIEQVTESNTAAEIRPVVRIIATRATIAKMLAVLSEAKVTP